MTLSTSTMRRREFLAGLAASALTASLPHKAIARATSPSLSASHRAVITGLAESLVDLPGSPIRRDDIASILGRIERLFAAVLPSTREIYEAGIDAIAGGPSAAASTEQWRAQTLEAHRSERLLTSVGIPQKATVAEAIGLITGFYGYDSVDAGTPIVLSSLGGGP